MKNKFKFLLLLLALVTPISFVHAALVNPYQQFKQDMDAELYSVEEIARVKYLYGYLAEVLQEGSEDAKTRIENIEYWNKTVKGIVDLYGLFNQLSGLGKLTIEKLSFSGHLDAARSVFGTLNADKKKVLLSHLDMDAESAIHFIAWAGLLLDWSTKTGDITENPLADSGNYSYANAFASNDLYAGYLELFKSDFGWILTLVAKFGSDTAQFSETIKAIFNSPSLEKVGGAIEDINKRLIRKSILEYVATNAIQIATDMLSAASAGKVIGDNQAILGATDFIRHYYAGYGGDRKDFWAAMGLAYDVPVTGSAWPENALDKFLDLTGNECVDDISVSDFLGCLLDITFHATLDRGLAQEKLISILKHPAFAVRLNLSLESKIDYKPGNELSFRPNIDGMLGFMGYSIEFTTVNYSVNGGPKIEIPRDSLTDKYHIVFEQRGAYEYEVHYNLTTPGGDVESYVLPFEHEINIDSNDLVAQEISIQGIGAAFDSSDKYTLSARINIPSVLFEHTIYPEANLTRQDDSPIAVMIRYRRSGVSQEVTSNWSLLPNQVPVIDIDYDVDLYGDNLFKDTGEIARVEVELIVNDPSILPDGEVRHRYNLILDASDVDSSSIPYLEIVTPNGGWYLNEGEILKMCPQNIDTSALEAEGAVLSAFVGDQHVLLAGAMDAGCAIFAASVAGEYVPIFLMKGDLENYVVDIPYHHLWQLLKDGDGNSIEYELSSEITKTYRIYDRDNPDGSTTRISTFYPSGTILGSVLFESGTIDLVGRTLTIYGDLIQSGGTLKVNDGKLVVKGDYRMQTPGESEGSYTFGNGTLRMTDTEGSVLVEGDFVMDSTADHDGDLTAGTLELKGNFYQKRSEGYSYRNFKATSSHRVVLSGSELQTVSFESARLSYFNYLIVNNTGGGVSFMPSLAVNWLTGDDSAIMMPLAIEDMTWTLKRDHVLSGDLHLKGSSINLNGHVLRVDGNLIHSGGIMDVRNGRLEITGDYRIQKLVESEVNYTFSNGTLRMMDTEGSVLVEGDFVMDSTADHDGDLTAGTLELKGDFYQKRSEGSSSFNFKATSSHRVVLSGSELQTISFDAPPWSRFNILEVHKFRTNSVEFVTDVIVTTLYEHHQNPVTYKASISTPDYDGDGLLDYLDPLPQVPIANLAGNLAQVNGDVTQFTLEAGYYDPVVILGLPTSVHSGEGVARVSDVSAEGFVLRFQEWDYLDGVHGVEEIPYLVASKGHYHTADGAVIEVYKGTLEAGQAAQWVEFAEPFTAPPMVFPTLQTMNAPTAAALRIGEVTQEGFWVTVTEQESRREETRVAEVLGYVAILDEDGEGSLIINGEEVPYSLQRHQIPPTGLIVNGVGVVMEEEQSLDDETMHLPEWAGFWRLGGDLFAQVDSNLEADTLGLRITADTSGFVPFVGAGADTSGTEGASVSFEGSFIPSNTDAEYTIEWDFGDETVASGSLTVAHVFHQPGEFLVTLTVTGSDGAYASDTLTATIANALLTADAGENQNVAEGEVVSFVAGVTDEGGEDTYGYQWAFGDGNEAQGQSVTHAYADNGVYQVTLTVTDGEGGVANDNQTVTVANVDPVAEAGANQSVKEGDTVSFTGSATDAGSADTFSYVWDFGDGSSATAGKSASHVYADNGVYTVTLSVTDDDEGVGTDTQTVSVANVAPVVAVDPAELFAGSSTIGFSGAFNDAGSADTHNFEWDFGDGVINIGSLETSHIFGASGLFDVTLTVTDDDGGEDSAWVSVRTWTLDVSAGNGGSVTSAMSGIDCETDCTESYPEGTAVALTATPEIGYLFDGWGGACNGDGACSVTLNGDLSVTASFIPDDLPCSTEPEVLTATDYDSINSEVSIESDGFVELLETDAVEYRAPVIRFLPDFRAPYGSELRAKAVTVSCQ